MNAWDMSGSGRERGALVAVIVVTLLLVSVILFGLLLPVQAKRAEVAGARSSVEEELAGLPGSNGPDLIRAHAAALEERIRLETRWEVLREWLDTFKTPPSFARAAEPTEEGRIDFKVALFEARSNLLQKAQANGVFLPDPLGMDETIAAHEDAETRLWQLSAVVKLIENCIDIGMSGVESVEILAPYDHTLSEERRVYTREFPTRIQLACSFEDTRALLDQLQEEGSFFALRGFRAERISKYRNEPLAVTAVYSGTLFDVREEPVPEEVPADDLVPGTVIMGPATNEAPGEIFAP
jgi:hypothetical protein